jgi:hypothetical protein
VPAHRRTSVLLLVVLLTAAPLQADTLTLKDGTVYQGQRVGTTKTRLAFKIDGKLRWFDLADVAKLDVEPRTRPHRPRAEKGKAGPRPKPPGAGGKLARFFADTVDRVLVLRATQEKVAAMIRAGRRGRRNAIRLPVEGGGQIVIRGPFHLKPLAARLEGICRPRCYKMRQAVLAAKPFGADLSRQLARDIQRLGAYLDAEHAKNEEDARCFYHAVDPLVRPVLGELKPADGEAAAWPPPELAKTVGRRAWPPPKGFDAEALRERAQAEAAQALRFYGHGRTITYFFHQVSFSRDGRLMTGSEMRIETGRGVPVITLWDVATRRPLGHMAPILGASNAGFSPDGRRLVVTGDSGPATLYDAGTCAEIRKLDPFDPDVRMHVRFAKGRRFIAWSPNGISMAASTVGGHRGVDTYVGFFHDPKFLLPAKPGYRSAERSSANRLVYSPDGYTVVFEASFDPDAKRAIYWDGPRTAPKIPWPGGKPGHLQRVAFSHDGTTFACLANLGRSSLVCVWDWPTLRLRKSWQIPAADSNTDAAFHLTPDGRYVLYRLAGPLTLCETATEKVIRTYPPPTAHDWGKRCTVHPSGMFIAVRYNFGIVLWGSGLSPVVSDTGRVVLTNAAPDQTAAEMPGWVKTLRHHRKPPEFRKVTSEPFDLPPTSQ